MRNSETNNSSMNDDSIFASIGAPQANSNIFKNISQAGFEPRLNKDIKETLENHQYR
jgi:hypothetical protein